MQTHIHMMDHNSNVGVWRDHDNDTQLLAKYRKFVINVANIIDEAYANVSNKDKATQELIDSIEQDCIDYNSIRKWVTCEYVHAFSENHI